MPKVLFVISGLGAGGAEKVLSQIANHWLSRDIDVEIASFDTREDPVFHDFNVAISCHRLGRISGGNSAPRLSKLQDLLALRKLLNRRRPDIVISFLTKNNLLALMATLGTALPVVCCERNNPQRQKKHPAWNFLLRFAYQRARLIVCQTEAVKICFPKSVQHRLRVIPNPIKPWPFLRNASRPRRIVAVGRLTEQKGFDLLIKAFAMIQQSVPDWHLEIFGEGSQRGSLEQLIARLNLAERVKLVGNSSEPGGWIESADLFVLSSRYEGFGNVLGEAMAAGLPVISADCDFGPADMVDHMGSGVLVPSENPRALADAMLKTIEDEPLRERLGANAAKSTATFAPQRVMQLWDDLLDEALSTSDERLLCEMRDLTEPGRD